MSNRQKHNGSDTVEVPVGDDRRHLYRSLTTPIDATATIELFTVEEVAKMLKISKSSVRRLQSGRHLRFHKVGGAVRFSKNDIVAYLEKRRVESID